MISQDRALRVQYEQQRKAQMDALAGNRDHYLWGQREGLGEGKRESKRSSIGKHCRRQGIELTAERQARMEAMSLPELEQLEDHLLDHHAWP